MSESASGEGRQAGKWEAGRDQGAPVSLEQRGEKRSCCGEAAPDPSPPAKGRASRGEHTQHSSRIREGESESRGRLQMNAMTGYGVRKGRRVGRRGSREKREEGGRSHKC